MFCTWYVTRVCMQGRCWSLPVQVKGTNVMMSHFEDTNRKSNASYSSWWICQPGNDLVVSDDATQNFIPKRCRTVKIIDHARKYIDCELDCAGILWEEEI